jgi:hypothetical protein
MVRNIFRVLIVVFMMITTHMALSQPRTFQSENKLKVGDMAPVFKLASLDGKDSTDLAQFRGEKPVVLFFGSYT